MLRDQLARAGNVVGCGDYRAWRDNVFVGHLWKTVKNEDVYLHAYDSVSAARESIMQYLDWYNHSRPHSRIEKKTTDKAYAAMPPAAQLLN